MDLSELETQNLLIQQLKDLVRQKDSEVEEKSRCLKEAESKIAKSRLQLKAKDAKLSHLKKTMNQSRASGSSHEGEHEPRSGDSTNIKSKLLFQQKKIEEKERTIEVQQQTLQEQEMKFDKLREEFHSRHEELCQRLQQVSSSQGIDVVELTDNTPHVKDLYSAIMAKDQKIAELMSQVDESTFKLNNITQELQRSEEERAILSEKYEGNENLIAKQSSRVSDLEELVQSMSDGYETETNTIEELQRQVAKLEMRLHDKEETVAVKEEQILQLKRENNASLDDMQETNHQHDQLMRSLKRKLHEQEEVLAGKEKVVVLLQSELTDRSIEMSGLQNTIQLLQESIRDNMKANNHPSTASMYSEDRTNNNSDDDDEMVDLNKSSWDDGEGINFKNKYDQLLVQKDLQTAENAELKEQIQELEQKSYGLEVQLRELNQQFNDEAGEWREKEMAYDVKLTSYSSEVLSSTADTVRAQEDMDARMKTILSQMNNQTKVLEDQTHCLEKSEAEVKRLKQTVSSYKTNNNQLQTELKEQKQQFEATTEDLRQHMVATEVRFNIQLREVERAKLLFQEYLDSSHHQLETLLIEEHFSREVDSLVSSGDCTQYSDQINHFKNQVNLLRSKSQERFEPGEEITPAISCLIDQASTRTTTLASTFDLSRMLIRYLRQERDQILSESKDLSERLSEKRSIEEQAEELRRTLEEREEKLKSQSEFIEKLKAERLAVDEKLRQLDERFREFASDSKKISCERESWIEEMKMTHERDIAEAHRDRSDLEARLKAVTHQREVMARERDMMEEKLRTVEKDNDDVMWRMDERLSKLEAELDAKVSEHESMVSEMQVKHEEMVEGLMCDLEAATNRLESEKDELLHRLKEATTHAEQLKRDSDKCNNEIKHLTSKNSEFEVRIEALTGSCLDRDHELKSAVEKRDAAEKVLVELRAHLSDSSQEIGRLQANIQHKSEDLLKAEKERDALAYKVGELERRNDEMTNDYWLESSDSRQSELLKQERDVAISRATDLQDAVDELERIISRQMSRFIRNTEWPGESENGNSMLHRTILAYFEHQSEVEKKLVETEDKLKTAKLQLQDKMNANGFDNDLQMFQDPSLMKGDSQKQQTIQFLQSQLEELAREQEYQTSEHMSIVGRMNENIERLTEEKEDLSTSLERQVESLNEIAKRYDEKESDCHRLIRVVDDLQHKLEEAKALREDNFVTSQKYTARLRHAEDRINEFEDKLQDSMEELMMTKDEKEKCERKIPVLNRNLEETRAENLMLLDELKRLRSSVKFLQQELESASEAAEQMGKRHRDEVQQLKSLLRERDERVGRFRVCEFRINVKPHLHTSTSTTSTVMSSFSRLSRSNSAFTTTTNAVSGTTSSIDSFDIDDHVTLSDILTNTRRKIRRGLC